MRLVLRWAILLLTLGGLAYGLLAESRTVHSLRENPAPEKAAEEVDGIDFIDGSTYDRFVLHEGVLCDALSLQPEFAQVKDCKT
jgi:hypothetical protein